VLAYGTKSLDQLLPLLTFSSCHAPQPTPDLQPPPVPFKMLCPGTPIPSHNAPTPATGGRPRAGRVHLGRHPLRGEGWCALVYTPALAVNEGHTPCAAAFSSQACCLFHSFTHGHRWWLSFRQATAASNGGVHPAPCAALSLPRTAATAPPLQLQETLYQSTSDGKKMVDMLKGQGVTPGIKVDKGLAPLPGSNGEQWCQGQGAPCWCDLPAGMGGAHRHACTHALTLNLESQ